MSNMSCSRVELHAGWEFKEQHDDKWLPVAQVPTQVHMDLLANEKIPDPFVDLNERAVQWVGEKTWVYRLDFPAPSADGLTTDLVFEGLDTFATVSVNKKQVLKTDNMFVSYRVDISEHVKAGGVLDLEIVFESALLRGRELVKEHSHEHNFLVRQTEVGRVPVRKAQYNWGWDWGPILMTSGPWKPVYLEQYVARVDDVWAQNEVSKDLKTCSGSVFAKVFGATEGDKAMVSLSKDGKVVFETETTIENSLAKAPFKIDDPELWYPLGYGSQTRYELQAKLIRGSTQLDSRAKLIGFRRAELIQEPDSHGKSFYFRINNIDIFSGGSCWIPADSLLPRLSKEKYYDWVKLVAEGNQVLLRIWGGGVYEHEVLMDACDELGVLVWHDFQFACASYPAYPSYLKGLETEIRQQVRRMRSHVSMIAWSGNNEDYQVRERYSLDYNLDDKDPESWIKSSFPARYLYESFIPRLVEEEDPFMIYHPSSPWGEANPRATTDPSCGDIHQWNLWHGAMNKYQELEPLKLGGRFVSEFGMEAYPHLSTIHRMTTEQSQLYPGSMVLDFHNKGIGHERRMMTYVVENFRPKHDLESYLHLTQVVQSESMRAAYKAWRRDWGEAGQRKCGGALVWQLNDCWPTVSWGVVDYYLVKKPAYYVIARALRQIDVGVSRTFFDWTTTGLPFVDENSKLFTGQVDQTLPARKGTFDVWIASSSTAPVDVKMTVRFISVKSGKDVSPEIKTNITAAPNSTTEVLSKPAPTSMPDPEDITKPFDIKQWDPYVIHATLSVDGAVVATDTAWPDPVKFLDLSDRGVSFEVSASEVVVRSERPVKGLVFEEMEGLKLSDNGFDLVPGEKQTVQVQGKAVEDLKFTYVGAPRPSLEIV